MSAGGLDPRLLEVLACPSEDHAPLQQRGDTLVCTSCGRAFPIVDGIPVLLLDEALPPGDTAGSGADDRGPEGSPEDPRGGRR